MKPTLSIGIAAYNEAENIGGLLDALLRQKIESATLIEILVVSDASIDNTDAIVESFVGKTVKLVRFEKRGGVNAAQNVIMSSVRGDVLISMDADILPEKDFFVEKLIEPILADASVGLTSAVLTPANPVTFVEKVLCRNHEWKSTIFSSINGGNNLYTCYGPARAFSRSFYAGFQYPEDVPNDAMSYMSCIARKFRFISVVYPRAIFRCPSNILDHIKQGTRFLSGRTAITSIFGDIADKEYRIPHALFFKEILKECLSHPILFLGYVTISVIVRIQGKESFSSRWDIATSSKKPIT